MRVMRVSELVDAPTDFKLALNLTKVAEELIMTGRSSTHFAGQAKSLASFGGRLDYAVIEGFEAYYYPAHVAAAHAYTTELVQRIRFFEAWLGAAESIPGITPFPAVVESIDFDAVRTVLQMLYERHVERMINDFSAPTSEAESFRFLFATITTLPGGAPIAENALRHLPSDSGT